MITVEMLIALLCILGFLYFHFDRKAKYWKRRGVNGPKALPIIGNLLDTIGTPQNELEETRRQKYGKVYGVMQGTTPVLTIADPDLLKQIMISDFPIFMNHRDNFHDPLLKQMLSELKNDEWRRVRGIMSPAFTTGKLNAMQPLIEKCIQNTFNYLDSVDQRNEEVNIKRVTLAYTLDSTSACIFAANTNASKNPNEEFVVNAHDMVNFPIWRLLTRTTFPVKLQEKYDVQILSKRLVDYFKTFLTEVIKKRRETSTDRVDFVTLLLNAEYSEEIEKTAKELKLKLKEGKAKLTEDEIICNCLLFFLWGYETTATMLQFTLYALAMNPDIQQKLYEEIDEYVKINGKIEYDSLNALPYFDAVCKESLRLYSPLTVIEHVCGENYKLGDIAIEKGTIINLAMYAMHRDADYFPNPHEFNPQRFMPENKDNIKQYSFIPFGLGPRICVGNRFSNLISKLYLANFIRNYEVVKTKNTPEKIEYTGKLWFLSCKPMFATFRRRFTTAA